MITLILSTTGVINVPEIIGWILSGLEIAFVVLQILGLFIPPESKFGKWLSGVLDRISIFLHHKKEIEKKEEKKDEKSIDGE